MENLKEKNSMSRKRFEQGDAGQVAGQNSAGQTPDKFLRDMPRAGQRGTSPSTHQINNIFFAFENEQFQIKL